MDIVGGDGEEDLAPLVRDRDRCLVDDHHTFRIFDDPDPCIAQPPQIEPIRSVRDEDDPSAPRTDLRRSFREDTRIAMARRAVAGVQRGHDPGSSPVAQAKLAAASRFGQGK